VIPRTSTCFRRVRSHRIQEERIFQDLATRLSVSIPRSFRERGIRLKWIRTNGSKSFNLPNFLKRIEETKVGVYTITLPSEDLPGLRDLSVAWKKSFRISIEEVGVLLKVGFEPI
jgi:hypothetical protein